MNKTADEKDLRKEYKHFKFTMPIVKTKIKTVKNEKGEETEERYLIGEASNTEVDLQGDKMAPEAIRSMADSLKMHVINLNDDHDTGWSSELGDITKLDISNNNGLIIESRLNDLSTANDLWLALTKHQKQLGLSIGGYVKEYDMEKTDDGSEWIKVLKDVELDHIAVTQSPANPTTWLNAIIKSINPKKSVKKKDLSEVIAETIKKKDFINKVTNLIRSELMTNKDSLEAEKKKNASAAPEDEKQTESVKEEVKEVVEEKSVEEKPEEKAETEIKEEVEAESKEEVKEEAEKSDKPEEEIEEEEADKEEATTNKDLSSGYDVVEVAMHLDYVISYFDYLEKDTTELKAIKESLKSIASEELKEPEATAKSEDTSQAEQLLDKISKAIEVQKIQHIKEVEELVSAVKYLKDKVETLENQPSDRKAVIEKFDGDESISKEDGVLRIDGKTEDEAVEELRKNNAKDPMLFSKTRRIRQEYAKVK